jgi:hypothetical protein
MRKHARLALAEIEKVAKAAGCTAEYLGHAGDSHYKVAILREGKTIAKMPISCSPKREDDCINMCRQLARRLIAQAA